MSLPARAARDGMIEKITAAMHSDPAMFFVAADFGSPKLDALREAFPARFLNVGIAEQNLINVATGLALEGNTVYAYAIAPFITMRCYEQIRINLAVLSEVRTVNVNLIGVGAGFSYDCSGPSHQAFEDLAIMRLLPNVEVLSPADWVCAAALVDFTISNKYPKYIRLDGKALAPIYQSPDQVNIEQGFQEVKSGKKLALVSTGYMTHKALDIATQLDNEGFDLGVIDVFMFKHANQAELVKTLRQYAQVITMEEGFIGKGGLDTFILGLIRGYNLPTGLDAVGMKDKYFFAIGSRESLHRLHGAGKEDIIAKIRNYFR